MGVLQFVLVFLVPAVVSSTEYVPVLLWNSEMPQESIKPPNSLIRLSSDEFSDFLTKVIKIEKPMILAFMEENLSVEDFSWKDLNGVGAYPGLKNITRAAEGKITFLTSVHNPYKALKNLKNVGYVWKTYNKDLNMLNNGKNTIISVKLDEPTFSEDRPQMLREHDKQMSEIYKRAILQNPNILLIYTGKHTSWMNTELLRSKRDDTEKNGNETLIISDVNNVVRISVSLPIIFKRQIDDKTTIVNITELHGTPTTKEEKGELVLRARFPITDNEDDFVDFRFSSSGEDWWTLNSADIDNMKESNLKPLVDVGAPSSYSYFCNPSVTFTNGKVTLIFENMQVQPRVGKGNTFGPIVHCIPFFSIAILSGLATVLILSMVLGWGITMIMDINTNDRFDDPKGKTITITSTD